MPKIDPELSYEKRFESILDFSDFLEKGETPKRAAGLDRDFGGITLADTRDILKRGGYHEQSGKNMDNSRLDASKFPQRESINPMPELTVAGHRPNVGAFLAGSPLSMVRNSPETRPDRRVKMLVASTSSCGVSDAAMLARGAAIMGAIEHLSAEGFAVELTVGFYMSSENNGPDGVYLPVKVKGYQDTFDPSVMGFILTDPSFPRKALFTACYMLIKQNPDNKPLQTMVGGLGYPMTESMDHLPYDVIFEAIHYHDDWTQENAPDKVMAKVYAWLERTGGAQ